MVGKKGGMTRSLFDVVGGFFSGMEKNKHAEVFPKAKRIMPSLEIRSPFADLLLTDVQVTKKSDTYNYLYRAC